MWMDVDALSEQREQNFETKKQRGSASWSALAYTLTRARTHLFDHKLTHNRKLDYFTPIPGELQRGRGDNPVSHQ